jgi:hypothetical protein
MEILIFTLVGVALYFGTEWVLAAVERTRGEPVPYRQVIFFLIFMVLALVVFPLMRELGRFAG